MLDGKLEQMISDIVEGSFSQTGILSQIKSGQRKDKLNNIKYSAWNSTKQTLKDLGNDMLNDKGKKINYIGHKWDEHAETGQKVKKYDTKGEETGANKYMERVILVVKRMLKKLRRGPISTLEVALDILDIFLAEYDNWNKLYYNGSTIKWYVKSGTSFKAKLNLLYKRLDQCFAVMPPWFLQTLNLLARTWKGFKGTKLPYNMTMLNSNTAYNYVHEYTFKMLDDYNDHKSGKDKVPHLTDKDIKQPKHWYNRLALSALKSKLVGALQIDTKERAETLRKNTATLRRMGVERSVLEKRNSANKILERLSSLFNDLAPTLGGWTKELSHILKNREMTRAERGLAKKMKRNKSKVDWRAEGAT